MIRFFWIVLITFICSAIIGSLVTIGVYIFLDTIKSFFEKRNIPKNKEEFLDGGKTEDIKEVKEDGRYREHEKFRAVAIGERTTKAETNNPRFFSNEPRDTKIDTIARSHRERDNRISKGDESGIKEKW